MYKKITLAEIKQEAKDLKKSNPKFKHTEALNKIAQKYGYEKFEILKAKLITKLYIEIEIDITEPISFLKTPISEETFNPLATISKGAYSDVFNAPTPDIETTEDMLKTTLENLGLNITLKATPLKNITKENKQIAVIGGAGSGKTTLLFREHEYLDKKTTLFITPAKNNSLNGYPYHLEKEGYEKHFNKTIPIFKKALFKTYEDKNIDLNKFETIVIEEAMMLKTNNILLADIMKIIAGTSKTVILIFQEKEAVKGFGLALSHKVDLRDYGNPRSTPLDLFNLYVGGSGMSYFGRVE